jgi:hypothetical protein
MDLKTWLRAQWDRVLGGAGVGIGLLALLLGYRGVADTPYPAEQIPFVVSGGVLGIALIGIGLTAWLSADLRDEWRKLDRIERLLEQRAADAARHPTAAAAAPAVVDPIAAADVTGRSENGHAAVPPLASSGPAR